MLLSLTSTAAAQVMTTQTFYVPLPEDEIQVTLATLNPEATSTTIESVTSIAIALNNTVIVYDHWEDGYEADIDNSAGGGTTEIWGDGNAGNGAPPGFPGDLLGPGDVIILRDLVETPVVAQNPPLFNGRDKFASTRPIAVTRVAWAPNPGTVLAGAVEVFPTQQWGTSFQAPVGEDIPSDEMFELVTGSYMAQEDGTVLELFNDGVDDPGDDADDTVSFDQGETFLIPLGFPVVAGALATTNKPVQLHAMTGDIGAIWESRWYVVLPNNLWDNEYFVPVSTRQTSTTDPTDVFVFNPNSTSITVSCQALADCTDTSGATQNSLVIAAGDVGRFRVPNNSGSRFSGDGIFYATATIDSDPDDVPNGGSGTDSSTNNRDYDWGLALVPTSELSTQALVGFAPAIDPSFDGGCSPFNANNCTPPSGSGSPVWVMAATTSGSTTVYVDFDGDALGPNTDPAGNNYDVSVTLNALENAKIFDTGDNDNTGTLLYTLDGTLIATAWGQDPESSVRTNPYFDAGTFIPALPLFTIVKDVDQVEVEPGATLTYTVLVTNTSRADVPDVVLQDDLPPYVTYVEDSTELDGVPLGQPDGGVFPLAAGVNLGNLPPGETFTVTFQVTVNLLTDPTDPIVIGDDTDDVCLPGEPEPDNQTALINNATVTALGFTEEDDALTCVPFPPEIDIRKQAEGTDTRTFLSNSDVLFEIEVTNTGQVDLFNVVVDDPLVMNCDNNIGDLAAGDSVTYTCIAPGVTLGFTNEACVEGTDANGETVDDCDPSTVEIIDIDIRKQAEGPDSRTFLTGSDVTFEIEVTNTGDADLVNVVVTDVLSPSCDRNIGDLAAGDSVTYTCTALDVTQGFENEACVEGSNGDATVEDCDPSTVEIIDIDIRKQAEGPDTRTFPSGSDVDFEIVVTNTGPEDLVNVVVTDFLTPDCDNVIGALASGDSVTYTCTAPNVTVGFDNEACVAGERNGLMVDDCDPSEVVIEAGGGEGCTPGYWKQTQHFGSWTAPYSPVAPETLFSDVFENAFPGKTLLEVLGTGGGGLKALGRHTVAALLNTASSGVSYDLSTAQVIDAFNAVFPGSKRDYNGLKAIFSGFNEQGCPLGRAELPGG
jgi:uncharacterized repeat protein (TIGR01451 family)